MIKKFDVSFEIGDKETLRENIYASDVLEMFEGIPWQEQYQKCLASEDEFGPFFSVTYKDKLNLEYAFDIELYVENEEAKNNKVMSFSLTYDYQEIRMKKIFFGLFGEKEEIKNEYIFMDDQTLDFTCKCLQAFLRHDHNFLLSNMHNNF